MECVIFLKKRGKIEFSSVFFTANTYRQFIKTGIIKVEFNFLKNRDIILQIYYRTKVLLITCNLEIQIINVLAIFIVFIYLFKLFYVVTFYMKFL